MRRGGSGGRRAIIAVAAAVVALGLSAAACGGEGGDGAGRPVELSVHAAASLRTAVDAAARAYEADAPGTTVLVSTGSSAALRTQIEQGAPADLFLSADTANPEALVAAGRAIGPPTAFAGNAIVLVTPADDPAGIASPADLARPGVTIVAAGDAVPITRYADEVVARLAALTDYPADFAARYSANVASREDDVGAVAAKVALGEADAAFVYATDAADPRLRTVPLPPEAAVAATYAGVVIDGSTGEPAAADFLAWLAGPDGRAILADAGFGPPP